MKILINRDPVNIFWSIIFIIANIYILYNVYNNIDGRWTDGDDIWLLPYVTICICSLMLSSSDIKLVKYTESSIEIPLWMFASVITITVLFLYLSITSINSTIRYIFETPKSDKSLWKRIISKIAGI
jgi:hypothetical protein